AIPPAPGYGELGGHSDLDKVGRPRARQRGALGGRVGAAERTATWVPKLDYGADATRRRGRRCYWSVPSRAGPVLGRGSGAAPDLRRPGRDCHRERPPVQGAGGPQP